MTEIASNYRARKEQQMTDKEDGFTFEAAEEASRIAADAAEMLTQGEEYPPQKLCPECRHVEGYGHSPACTLALDHAGNKLHTMLDERGARYGKFVDHARVTQNLKRIVGEELWRARKKVANDQFEALEMILHKIGRIVCGDPDYEDSWRDIAGYATLVADRLKTGEER